MLRGALLNGRQLAGDSAEGEYDGSDSTFVDTVKDYVNTSPKEWTDDQYLSLATGVLFLWTMVLLVCIYKRNKRQQEDDTYMNMSHNDAPDHAKQDAMSIDSAPEFYFSPVR